MKTPWFAWFLILAPYLSPFLHPTHGFLNPTFLQKLSNLQNYGVSPNQLEKWWKEISRHRNPRVFPLCITKNSKGSYPPSLQKWTAILDDIEKKDWRQFEQTEHLWMGPSSPSKLEAIYLNTVHKSNLVDDIGYQKLDQWLYLHFRLRKPYKAQGFLLQAITGPLGLPGGEFDNKMYCHVTTYRNNYLENLQKDVPNWSKVSFVEPCSFAPRSSIVWPNVFIMDGTRVSPDFTTNVFSVRFRWSEVQCQETGFFQLIYVITPSFKEDDYEVKLSPVWSLNQISKGSGVSTGAYNGFVGEEGYHCNPPAPKIEEDFRLIPNSEFDLCVTKGIGRDRKFTCPPGPFKCGNLWESMDDWDKNVGEWKKVLMQKMNWNWTECCEFGKLPEPAKIPTTTLSPGQGVELELAGKLKNVEKAGWVTHGDLCILTWFLLLPVADHVARFYKDFPDFKKIGLGFWIISHVFLHMIGLVLIWQSFGLIIGEKCNILGYFRHFMDLFE
ncbi:unnamed protein product [Orchesella dallaii]|uniref:Uncharacterized protein n=1 Tax=Orchesella dallaii TaxID=48710 RepID=A0ABP1RJM7_9HEXA